MAFGRAPKVPIEVRKQQVFRRKEQAVADILLDAIEKGIEEEETDISNSSISEEFFKYAGKPLQFFTKELGVKFAPKIQEVIQSIEDNPITVVISSNGYGKTHAAAHIGAYWQVCHPESQVWTTMPQPEENLKRLLWGEIGLIERKHGDNIFQGYVSRSIPGMNIERHSKCGIYGVTIPGAGSGESRESRFSGKHAPYILFIVDEADGVPDEIFRAIEGCLSGGIKARLLCMFNPKMESGAVYEFIKRDQAHVIRLNALEHPNVVSGKDIYPGAVTRDTTVRRIWEWTEPLGREDEIDDACFQIPNYLVGHIAPRTNGKLYPPCPSGWRRINNPQFSYAVLAQYPTMAEGQLIDKAKLNQCVARWKKYQEDHANAYKMPHEYIQPIGGLDIAETTDDNSLCLRYDYYVAPPIVWRGSIGNLNFTARKAAKICEKENSLYCNTDANGLGATAHLTMREEGIEAYGIKITWSPTDKDEDFGEFDSFGDQGWWLLRQWIHTNPNAMVPDDEKLLEELRIQMYWKTPRGKIKVHSADYFREKLKRSPDRSFSLMLTHCIPRRDDEPGDLFIDNYAFDSNKSDHWLNDPSYV